jgi:hypothetical protein
VSLVIRCSDVTAALNEQPLRVTGLNEGAYTLRIDGAAVGTFSGVELAEGVNLAVLDTPMARQAKQVYDLSFAHNAARQARRSRVRAAIQTKPSF